MAMMKQVSTCKEENYEVAVVIYATMSKKSSKIKASEWQTESARD